MEPKPPFEQSNNEPKPDRSPLHISEETRQGLAELFEGKEIDPANLGFTERIKQKLEDLFRGGKADREKLPPVELKLYSSAHATAEDAAGLKELVSVCDLYIPEAVGWTKEDIKVCRDITSGEYTPPYEDDFGSVVWDAIHSAHKPVAIADMPEKEWVVLWNGAPNDNLEERLRACGYNEALELCIKTVLDDLEKMVVLRERYMLEHLPDVIMEAVQKYPELKKKNPLRVLMSLGFFHSALYHVLKEVGGGRVSRQLRSSTMPYGYSAEVERRDLFGKEISQELKERAFLEWILDHLTVFSGDFPDRDSVKMLSFIRYLAGIFDEAERKEIFEEWKTAPNNFYNTFNVRLGKKGIKFPQTEAELDEILLKTQYKGVVQKKEEQKNGK